jgi:hypothetical protein
MSGEAWPCINLEILPKQYCSVVVPGQIYIMRETSNEDELIVLIVFIILEVSKIAIDFCISLVVSLHLVN